MRVVALSSLLTIKSGPVYTLDAVKEVVSSTGAVDTPQLLMLSGIGDKTQLSKFKIETIVNSLTVGKVLQDHVVLPSIWSVNAIFTYDDVAGEPKKNWAVCNITKRGNWLV